VIGSIVRVPVKKKVENIVQCHPVAFSFPGTRHRQMTPRNVLCNIKKNGFSVSAAFHARIREVFSLNLDQDTGNPEVFLWFSSVHPG
jgi:hypothetical protein